MEIKEPLSLSELEKDLKPIPNVNRVHREHLRTHDWFALWITRHVGSIGFFGIVFLWTLVWLMWNVFAPAEFRFDPYPAFVLWLFISNMIQLILLPLIMVGQNLESRHSEVRAEADYEINIKSEKEIKLILTHLEYQNNLIKKLLEQKAQ